MKYGIFDAEGRPLAFYDDVRHQNIPDNAIQITDEQWTDLKDHAGQRIFDMNSQTVVPWSHPFPVLVQIKREDLRAWCEAAIVSGIENDALGASHHYPTTRDDQLNISGLRQVAEIRGEAGEPYKFSCRDVDGVWARRPHTASQITAVALAVADHVIAQFDHYDARLAEVEAASTAEAIDAVVW